MKRSLFLLIGILAVSTLVMSTQKPIMQDDNSPVIKFTAETYDYGTIYQSADGNCEFTFTNTGREPLVLTSVISSCGCTTPNWPREPILPGQSSTIKVHYDTKRLGAINKRITVNSNASNPTVVLTIKGNVIPAPSGSTPTKPVSGVSPVVK